MDKKYIKGEITGFNIENKTINIDGIDFYIEDEQSLEIFKPAATVLYYITENGDNIIEDIIPYNETKINTDLETGKPVPKPPLIYHSTLSYFLAGTYFLFVKNIGFVLAFFGLLFIFMLSMENDSSIIVFINAIVNFFIADLFDLSSDLSGGGIILFFIITAFMTILDLFPFTFKYFSNKEVTLFEKDVGFIRSLTFNFNRLNYVLIKTD